MSSLTVTGVIAGGVGRHTTDVLQKDGPQTLTNFLKVGAVTINRRLC